MGRLNSWEYSPFRIINSSLEPPNKEVPVRTEKEPKLGCVAHWNVKISPSLRLDSMQLSLLIEITMWPTDQMVPVSLSV